MFANMTIKAKFNLLLGSVVLVFLAIFFFSSIIISPVERSWQDYQKNVAERQKQLMQIKSNFGYGGGIHNFKNYVLRGTTKHYDRSLFKLNNVKTAIESYRGLSHISAVEQEALDKIEGVVNKYISATDKVKQAVSQGKTAVQVDKQVKISDGPALEAFSVLEEEYTMLTQKSEVQLSEGINSALTGIAFGLVAALFFLVAIVATLNHSITSRVNNVKNVLRNIASGNGDLTQRLSTEGKDEITELSTAFNRFADIIHDIIQKVSSASGEVSSVTQQLNNVTTTTLNGVQQQQNETQQVVYAMQQMSDAVSNVAANAAAAADAAQKTDEQASKGNRIVSDSVSSIEVLADNVSRAREVIQTLRKESENIGAVLDVIKDIAEQTNLLALNAAIEAARAGEQGRGFAVVADEVRTLAQRTQESTQEIQQIIETLQTGAEDAVKVMEKGHEQSQESVKQALVAGDALQSINEMVASISSLNAQIASAAEEQKNMSDEVNRNIANIESVASSTAQGASSGEQLNGSLLNSAMNLESLVGKFRI